MTILQLSMNFAYSNDDPFNSICLSKALVSIIESKTQREDLLSAARQIPVIEKKNITALESNFNPNPLHAGGGNTKPIFVAHEGKKYFLKILDQDTGLEEAAKYQFLADKSLGVSVKGLVKISDHKIGIMTDIIEGVLFKCCKLFGESELIKKSIGLKTVTEIRRIGKKLEHLDIDADDLQFIIKADGTPILIDPGEFKFLAKNTLAVWSPQVGEKSVAEMNQIMENYGMEKLVPGTQEYDRAYYPGYEVMARYLEKLLRVTRQFQHTH